MEYSKRSKKITKYKLTDEGKRVLEKLKLAEKPVNL